MSGDTDKLIERMRTLSAMINMGEKIAWGEDTALMDEAADRIASLEAERDDARRQRDEIGRAWDEADARAKEAEARAASMEAALEPFAEVGRAIKGRSVEYTIKADGHDLDAPLVDANDFRRAAALSSSKQKDGE